MGWYIFVLARICVNSVFFINLLILCVILQVRHYCIIWWILSIIYSSKKTLGSIICCGLSCVVHIIIICDLFLEKPAKKKNCKNLVHNEGCIRKCTFICTSAQLLNCVFKLYHWCLKRIISIILNEYFRNFICHVSPSELYIYEI